MTRTRLLHSLLLREMSAGCLAAALLAALTGAIVAFRLDNLLQDSALPSFAVRMLLRYDLTLLACLCIIVVLRTGQRISEDSYARWLEPYTAAGGDRRAYAGLLCLTIALAAFMVWLSGTLVFAGAVWHAAGSVELLLLAPRQVPAALLLICCFACYSALFALPIREPLMSFVIATLLALAPVLAAARHLLATDAVAPPPLLRLWMKSYPPPLRLAASPGEALLQLTYLALAAAVGALLSRRYAGRRP